MTAQLMLRKEKNIEKGNVVGYWNMLFEEAYKDGNEYFVQS